MQGRAAGGDDAFPEANYFLLAGLLLRVAGHGLHLDVEGIEKMAVAAHHFHLARLGHAGQAAGELAHDFRLVRAQLVDIDGGRGEADAGFGDVTGLLDHRGDMQQGLGRNAADIEADPAQRRVAFDDDRLHAQVGRAESGGIAAGTGAEHQHFAFEIDLAGIAADRVLPPFQGEGRMRRLRLEGRGGEGCRRRAASTDCCSGLGLRTSYHRHQRAFGDLVTHLDLQLGHHA